jgi:hypothetical protein
MAHLRKEIFPRGTYSKLNYKKIGPCRILRKIYDNAYKLELPENILTFLQYSMWLTCTSFMREMRMMKKIPWPNGRNNFLLNQVKELEQVLVKRIRKKT